MKTNPKDLVGAKKVSLTKVPAVAITHCAAAMMEGAEKYGAYNWRDNAIHASIYVDAAIRHLHAWFEGEEVDLQSGVSHLGHAMACCAIILDAKLHANLLDDRPKAPIRDAFYSEVRRITKEIEARRARTELKTKPPGDVNP